jgi:hypothetical protein
MKIGDQPALALPTSAAPATASHKADAWQAQLERAWLDSWQGDRPARPQTANPGTSTSANPTQAPRSGRPEAANPGSGSPLPERLDPSPAHGLQQADARAAPPRGPMASYTQAPAGTKPDCSSGPARPTESGVPASAARFAPAPAHGPDDAGSPAQAEARQGPVFDHGPGPAPARSALQVAVADGMAQVTLRDTALNASQAARIPQAIAHQLLESGLASVRLYVNGRLSQHTRSDLGPSRPRTHTDNGSTAAPLQLTSLERK